MSSYLEALINTPLPIDPWLVGILWLALILGVHRLAVRSRSVRATQQRVIIERDAAVDTTGLPRFILVRMVVAALLFALCYWVGEPLFSFVAGGFVAALAMAFGLNLHALAFARRLHEEGAVEGSVTLLPRFVVADVGSRALGAAVVFLIAGLAFAQLPLLGGALVLAWTGYRHVRRARQLRAVAANGGTPV